MFLKWISKSRARRAAESRAVQKPTEIFDRYVISMPSHQNAVDVVPGWNCSFPPEFAVTAGSLATYQDPRIAWMLEKFGSAANKSVLELGPLEGGHTVMLERAGAEVDAVEANQLAYLRCLITKEIFGMSRSRIWMGDFVKWLEATEKKYDLIVASGVLYHLNDPLHLIELIARRSDAVYFWTHFMNENYMPPQDPRRQVFAPSPEIQEFHGLKVRTYLRTYLNADKNANFCGGPMDEHRWLERDDLLAALGAVGFTHIELNAEEPDHQFGPAISIFAHK